MIDRASYEELGRAQRRLRAGRLRGLRPLPRSSGSSGRENWYLPEAELYHLEGQSYAADVRRPANRYNMWLHTHLWGEQIAELMETAGTVFR